MLSATSKEPATLPRPGHAFAKLFTQRPAALNCDSNVPIHLCSSIISSARPSVVTQTPSAPPQALPRPTLFGGTCLCPFSKPSPRISITAIPDAPHISTCTSHRHTSLRHVSHLSLTQPYYHHPFPYHKIPHHTAPRTPPLKSLESSLSPSPLSSYTAWLRRPGQQTGDGMKSTHSTCRNRAGKSCPVSGSRAGKAAD